MQKYLSQAEMVESEGIQAIVIQAAIYMVTAVMMVLSDASVGPLPAATTNPKELQREGHGGPALE